MTVLEARGIRKHFGGVVALDDANLTCRQGRITGLLGANGSGKSTMSKIITGVYSADAGEIRYNGNPVRYRNPNEARKDGIAMVFQNLSLVADLTVWQNIVLGAEQSKGLFLDNRAAVDLSREIVDQLLPGLDVRRMVHELNPGEMQIVEIAKAISENPRLLILDEPTAALEQAQVKSLFQTMRALVKKGVAIVFTSHRLWETMEICDDMVIFRNGTNVAELDFSKDSKDPEKIVSYITGETGKEKVEKTRRGGNGQVVLRVENLNYGSSLKNVSFQLKRGEILGIGGLAGQGQHELMLALAGNFPGVTGDVELNGKKIKLNKPASAIRNSILLVPGDRQLEGLFLGHSVFTNLIFPKLGLRAQPLFTPESKYRKESEKIVDVLSIVTHNLDMPVNSLSGGNQQKVVVGKWLAFDTNVLLLADPAKGVDVGAKRDLYDYIVAEVTENRMSVILYASDNEELVEYCDRLLIMYEGQIVATLEGDDINDDTIVATSMRVEVGKER
ncbi:MAG: sugar ABC transporter ATP-binding protein [Spirochaetaceae bacterium]|nr:MAG: sugar ABC transporter ATP-binding protein [Spirochaetaceae bacterium]